MATLMLVVRDGIRINPDRLLDTINRQSTAESDPISFPGVIAGISNIQLLAENFKIARADPQQRWKLAQAKDDALRLFASGCQYDSSADHANCALACVSPGELFRSLGTLSNCVTLSAASLFVKENALPESYLPAQIHDINGSAVLSAVVQCAATSCRLKSFGNCSQKMLNLAESSYVELEALSAFKAAFASYCDSFDVSVNADIAGPGVC